VCRSCVLEGGTAYGEREIGGSLEARVSELEVGGQESAYTTTVAYPGILFEGGSTNSVEDRGQRERGSGGGSPLVRGSAQFANE
jgi:hypothetical protein